MAMPTNAPVHDLGSLRIPEGQRKGGKLGKGFALFFGLLVVLAGLSEVIYTSWSQKVAVEVTVAQKVAGAGDREALLNASGYVTPRRRATIAAKITGRVTGVFFDEGTHVHQGQLLATLDDSDAKRALEAAKADHNSSKAAIADYEVQLKNARIVLHRAEQLRKAGVQSQEQLDNARAAADSFQAKLDLAKAQVGAAEARILEAQQAVDNCTIPSPFNGIVVSKDAQVGEMVSPISAGGGFTRTGIATIVDMDSNEIEVDVNEAYIARVRPGQRTVATLDAYPAWQIPCKVRTVIPTADRQKATVKVRVAFDHLDPRILPDMGVKVAFLSDPAPAKGNAAGKARAVIQKAAVRTDGGKPVVFLVRDGKIERRAVTLGVEHSGDVEVMAGLSPGETVVVRGAERLQEGQQVKIKR
jgi:RND family efflux transporter MFP subunit